MSGKAPTSTKHVLLTSSSRSNSDIESGTTNKAQEEEQQASLQSSGSNKKPPRKKNQYLQVNAKNAYHYKLLDKNHRHQKRLHQMLSSLLNSLSSIDPIISTRTLLVELPDVYFLVVSILEMNCFNKNTELFDISLTNGSSSNLPILCMVLLIELVTQVLEDRKKHIADAQANAKPSRWFNPSNKQVEDVQWRDLKVGDLIQVKQGEEFP